MAEDEFRAQFEKLGVENVRGLIHQWSGALRMQALNWVAEKDREREGREAGIAQEQIALAAATKDAAFASNALAEEANEIARAANDLAASATQSP